MRTLAENKTLIIWANHRKDWESVKYLTQERERLKKIRYCKDCGVRLSFQSKQELRPMRCQMHANMYRYGRKLVATMLLLLVPLLASAQTLLTNVVIDIGVITNFPPGITNIMAINTNGSVRIWVTGGNVTGLPQPPIIVTNPPSANSNFVSSVGLGTLRNDFSGFVGMQIRVTNYTTITALGRMSALSAVNSSHIMKVVDASDGTDWAVAVIPSTTNAFPGQFYYTTLSSPLIIHPGNFFIVSLEIDGGDQWYDVDTKVSTTPIASVVSAVWGYGPGHWYFTGTNNSTYGPLDFK